jgi:hypothetical protein
MIALRPWASTVREERARPPAGSNRFRWLQTVLGGPTLKSREGSNRMEGQALGDPGVGERGKLQPLESDPSQTEFCMAIMRFSGPRGSASEAFVDRKRSCCLE